MDGGAVRCANYDEPMALVAGIDALARKGRLVDLLISITTKNADALRRRWKLEGGMPVVPGQRTVSAHNQSLAAPSAQALAPIVADSTNASQSQTAANPSVNANGAALAASKLGDLTWRKENFVLTADPLAGSFSGATEFDGGLAVIDWGAKRVSWESRWNGKISTPHGMTEKDGVLYVGDLEAGHVFALQPNRPETILGRISNPAFNDVHGLWPTRRGMLVACSGTDCLIEFDSHGNSLWEWWAADHGFDMTPAGVTRASGRGGEHRDQYYHTKYQSTHINNVAASDDERYVYASLFHQGMVVEIDRSLPEPQQRAAVIVAGLARPHGPFPTPTGWLVCNSLGAEVLLLDRAMRVTERVPYIGGWIQHALQLENGNLIVNDVDEHRLVELAAGSWNEIDRFEYDNNWRVAEVRPFAGVAAELASA